MRTKLPQVISDSAWLKMIERIAVPIVVVVVVFVAGKLVELDKKIVKITTVQQEVTGPGMIDMRASLKIVTDNLLNQARFTKDDGLRLDIEHKGLMNELDDRLRNLELTGP